MKKLIVFIFLLSVSITTNAQEKKIKWISLNQAITLNKKNPKKILIDVYANWCYYCKVMDNKTYDNDKIATYINDNFYAVKFNAEQKEDINFQGKTFHYVKSGSRGYNELAVYLLNGKLSYPHTLFLNENEQVLTGIAGYLKPKQFEPILAYFASNAYLKNNWQSFSKDFKSKL